MVSSASWSLNLNPVFSGSRYLPFIISIPQTVDNSIPSFELKLNHKF